MISIKKISENWDSFFHTKSGTKYCDFFRIAYATLMLINLAVFAPDLILWFGESGAMSFQASRDIIDPDTLTIFEYLPKTDESVYWAFSLLLLATLFLWIGLFSRASAFVILILYVSFQHRNNIVFDGEDAVFRLFSFFLMLMPIGRHWALDKWMRTRLWKKTSPEQSAIWPIRFVQIQITIIYLSTVWEKLNGDDWLDGKALWYTSQLDDLFGRTPLPDFLFDPSKLGVYTTWSVLVIESLLPLTLWLKETRRYAILVGICFHLSIELSMHLFLFQWLMILGLFSFVTHRDLIWVRSKWRKDTAAE